MNSDYNVQVQAESFYIEDQSIPERDQYVFAYRITIRNTGEVAAKLMTRHWVITDANGKVQEVRGEGVVGEQPHLKPGDEFQYTSGAIIETPVGTMEGSYQMVADDGGHFDADISPFTLAAPRVLH
ncbi:MAG: Co2+/Mg2+ efflux protein ApaG [Gammaproteobacteria bacterium]|nr:Co2+/Mg2+ efflux protein ApaG [Gammaproteobacteria bacterium]